MAAVATSIADKLYVTIQYRGDANNEDGLLGFASPYTKDEAFRKRKVTQDSWAYGHGPSVTIDEEDNVTVSGEGHRGGYGASATKWDATMLFMANCYPKIFDNTPVEGFEIAKSVRRYGWNGGGNVKWRITDPRGFDLEISSENFASVLACCTMVNGVVQGNCVWGRMGKDNVLLPEASEPYQEAVVHTTKMNKKISLKDIKPGDTIELFNNNVSEKQAICEYLGKHYFLCAAGWSEDRGYTYSGWKFNVQSEGYLFRAKSNGEYFTVKTPKVIDIVEQCTTARDRAEIAKEATEFLANSPGAKVDNIYNCFLITPTKIKPEEVALVLEPITEAISAEDWPIIDNYYPENIICQSNGKLYWAERSGDRETKAPALASIEVADNKIKFNLVKQINQNRGYYYGGSYDRYDKVYTKDDPTPMKKFRITITANGLTGKVYRV
jgi:hypothetical protein